MKKFFVTIFGIFIFFLSTQSSHAYNYWNNNSNWFGNNYDNSYDYGYDPYCPSMSYYDEWSQVCQCYSGYIWYNYECISQIQYCQNALGANSRYDGSNNTCNCQNGYVIQGNKCIYQQPLNNTSKAPAAQQNTNTRVNTTDQIQEQRIKPTNMPPMAWNTPIPPDPTHVPRQWPTLMPSTTPRPVPSWLQNNPIQSSLHATPTPIARTVKDVLLYQKIENIVTPTLIPARRPIVTTTINQTTQKTASSSSILDWINGLFSGK